MIQKNIALRAGAGGNVFGAIAYVLSDKDHKKMPRSASPEILEGNAQQMLDIEKTMTCRQTYHSSVLAFTPKEMFKINVSPAILDEVLESYKAELACALNRDSSRLANFTVLHREADGSGHLHMLTMKQDLKTQRHYEPFNSRRGDIQRLHDWNALEVHRHGFVSPDALDRQRTGQYSRNLPQLLPESGKKPLKDIRNEIDAFISHGVVIGEYQNRQEVVDALNSIKGVQVQPTRSTKSLSIKVDEHDRNIRLQGVYYAASFTGLAAISDQAEARAATPIKAIQKRHAELTAKLQKEYGRRFIFDDKNLPDKHYRGISRDCDNVVSIAGASTRESERSIPANDSSSGSQLEKPTGLYVAVHRERTGKNLKAGTNRGSADYFRTEEDISNRILKAIKSTPDGVYYWQVANTSKAWACREQQDGSLAVRGTKSSWGVAAALAVNKGWFAVEIKSREPKSAIREHLKLGLDVTKCNDMTSEELISIKQEIYDELEAEKHAHGVADRRAAERAGRAPENRRADAMLTDADRKLGEIITRLGEANSSLRESGFSREQRITRYFTAPANRSSIDEVCQEIDGARLRRRKGLPLCQRDFDIAETGITELITCRQVTIEAELNRRSSGAARHENFRSICTEDLRSESLRLQSTIEKFNHVSELIKAKAIDDISHAVDSQDESTKTQAASDKVTQQFRQIYEQRHKAAQEHSLSPRMQLMPTPRR